MVLNPNDDTAFNNWDEVTTTTVKPKGDLSMMHTKADLVIMGTTNFASQAKAQRMTQSNL